MSSIFIPPAPSNQITKTKLLLTVDLKKQSILMKRKVAKIGKTTLDKGVFKVAKTLARKLNVIVQNMDLLAEWNYLNDLPIRPMFQLSREELQDMLTNLRTEIEKFYNTVNSSGNFEYKFDCMMYTDNCMRPCDLRDDLVIIDFCEYVQEVAEMLKKMYEMFNKVKTFKNGLNNMSFTVKAVFTPPSA